MKFYERSGGKSYKDWLNSLPYEESEKEITRELNLIKTASYIRSSEFLNEDKFGGDIIELDLDNIHRVTGITHVPFREIAGDGSYVLDEPNEKFGVLLPRQIDEKRWVSLEDLTGKNVRFILKVEDWMLACDICAGDGKFFGSIYMSQIAMKPYRITKLFEFEIDEEDETFKLDIVEQSAMYLLKLNTVLNPGSNVERVFKEHMSEVQNACKYFMFDTRFGVWSVFKDTSRVYTFISVCFSAYLQMYLTTLNRDCDFDYSNRIKRFKEEVLDFSLVYKDSKYVPSKQYDILDMGISPTRFNLEYISLVAKIAQLGSQVVVPRNSILDFEEFIDRYFVEDYEDNVPNYALIEELSEEFFNICKVEKEFLKEVYRDYALLKDVVENFYFRYVWNSLYFKVPKVWSEIAVNASDETGYVIKYDEVYNTIGLRHVNTKDENECRLFFSCDVDLDKLRLQSYLSNPTLESLLFDYKTSDSLTCVNSFVDRMLELFGSINDSSNLDFLKKVYSDLECSIRYEALNYMRYSVGELLNLCRVDKEFRDLSITAASIEDYSWVIVNYILICVLVCEKSKIKEALTELELELNENDELAPIEKKETIDNIKKLRESEVLQKKGNVYLFNRKEVKGLNRALGRHLSNKRKKCRYTTPYWVRRGFYKTSRSGEQVWIPEQICKRSPELLDLNVSSDTNTRVYKATDLFK